MLWGLMPFGVKTKAARSCSCGRLFVYFFLLLCFISKAAHDSPLTKNGEALDKSASPW